MKSKIINFAKALINKKAIDSLFFMRDEGTSGKGPSWAMRRKLIFATFRLAVAMIVAGAAFVAIDKYDVGTTLITSATALITIIVSAYVAGATYEDTRRNRKGEE